MKIQHTNKINFQLIFRIIFISVLFCVCFIASSFMVLESSEFFERFYVGENTRNFGFISALLNEVFLVIMAAVWVPAIQKGKQKIFHPANIFIKFLVIFLFINTVGGASLNTVQKKLDFIQEQENRIAVLKILQSQIEDQQSNIQTFKGQNQRVNTVLATRKLNQVKEELKGLQSEQQSTLSLWLDIILISLVRCTIQLANITSVWLASWLYRKILESSKITFSENSTNNSTAGQLVSDNFVEVQFTSQQLPVATENAEIAKSKDANQQPSLTNASKGTEIENHNKANTVTSKKTEIENHNKANTVTSKETEIENHNKANTVTSKETEIENHNKPNTVKQIESEYVSVEKINDDNVDNDTDSKIKICDQIASLIQPIKNLNDLANALNISLNDLNKIKHRQIEDFQLKKLTDLKKHIVRLKENEV